MRRIFVYIILILVLGIVYARQADLSPTKKAQNNNVAAEDSISSLNDSIISNDSIQHVDSTNLAIPTDRTSISDDDRTSITKIVHDKVDLDNKVTFSAKDSVLLLGGNNAFMYGESTVEYNDLKLNSGEIKMVMDSSTVYAKAKVDTTGEADSYPVFKDKSGTYESKTMKYNFKTGRGFITDVITEQGEGYLTGGKTKKMEDGTFFIENGKYTTCDDHEHPHFYFQLTKARVIPQKNIATGPAYMVLADVPLPIAVPFGYFPFSKDYSSGILFPSFGDDYNKGYYLRDGGYYFAINDNVDLALRGEIYTKGSWGISGSSSYIKRYKYRGSFDFSYITTVSGDKGSPDYAKQNNFRVTWSHTQDSKANPNMSFSASVNFSTSGYTRNDLNSYYSNSFTENTKSSTVNMTYRFPGTKWSLSTTANITQRTQDSTLAVSFPNLTITMSQTAPFKRKKMVGGERWYEKIKMSYSGQFQNSLTATQNQFFKKSLIKDWRNGMKHNIPISATFSIFKYINVSPSITINDRMYTNKVNREWDSQASREIVDTTYGFYNLFDFNGSLSFDTKIYGFFKPLKMFGDKIQMIRHVLTPTVSFSASPDFSSSFWGYYGQYSYVDDQGLSHTNKYNHFSNGIFGSPSSGKTGMVSVSFANNLEMKVKSDKDSTGMKKISLIENLSISQSYNFAADSLRWSNINSSILLRLVKNFNLSLSATWDPYVYGLTSSGSPVKLNKTRISMGKLPRLSSTGTSFSYTFNNDTFKRKKSGDTKSDKKGNRQSENDETDEDESSDDFAAAAAKRRKKSHEDDATSSDVDGYAAWAFPWNVSVNYSISYGYGSFDYNKLVYTGKWTQNLSLSGSVRPTKNWNFSFSASYNFDLHKLSYMNCTISRDMHCFTMSTSFVPVGPYKSYNFHISVKSSLLKDLKYDKRSSSSNGIKWY